MLSFNQMVLKRRAAFQADLFADVIGLHLVVADDFHFTDGRNLFHLKNHFQSVNAFVGFDLDVFELIQTVDLLDVFADLYAGEGLTDLGLDVVQEPWNRRHAYCPAHGWTVRSVLPGECAGAANRKGREPIQMKRSKREIFLIPRYMFKSLNVKGWWESRF